MLKCMEQKITTGYYYFIKLLLMNIYLANVIYLIMINQNNYGD